MALGNPFIVPRKDIQRVSIDGAIHWPLFQWGSAVAEREIDAFLVRSGANLEGTRYTAWLAVSPRASGWPTYYAICENRSFRSLEVAETAAAKALADMLGLEDDGTPIFPDDYTGFDDPVAPE